MQQEGIEKDKNTKPSEMDLGEMKIRIKSKHVQYLYFIE